MTKTTNKKKKRGSRIKGICADAKTLDVSREHLWMVLKGRRSSLPLMNRYKALKESQAMQQKQEAGK